jgi:hypothetical protein
LTCLFYELVPAEGEVRRLRGHPFLHIFSFVQGFENQELKYFTAGKGLVKGLPSYRRSLQPFREDIHFGKNTNFLFMGYFHISRSCPDPHNQLNLEWTRTGNTFYVSTRYTHKKK